MTAHPLATLFKQALRRHYLDGRPSLPLQKRRVINRAHSIYRVQPFHAVFTRNGVEFRYEVPRVVPRNLAAEFFRRPFEGNVARAVRVVQRRVLS